jgi:hypothetical protein
MVVAIFCDHPDNLEDSDDLKRGTVARLDPIQNRERPDPSTQRSVKPQ